jgi:hypothetical protein
VYRSVLRAVTVLAVIGAFGTAGLARTHAGQGQALRLGSPAYSAFGVKTTFAADPSAGMGGDMGMDNLYTLSNYICTDGIAINVTSQTLGDVNNTGNQGHSLELSSIQDYGTAGVTVPTFGPPTASSTNVPIKEAGTDGGYTFASAADNTSTAAGTLSGEPAGTWQGMTFLAHYNTTSLPSVGDQVVGTIIRRDHGGSANPGGILNEDDGDSPKPAMSNGDDSGGYGGWEGTDDQVATNSIPPFSELAPGVDWTSNTDGSSFDDIIRTDQGATLTQPNSFQVPPDPSTSKVEDCVIDPQAPTTSPSPDANPTFWYNAPVSVSLTPKAYYASTSVTTYYTLDGGALTTYTGSITVQGDRTHTLQYYSVDNSLGKTEATRTDTINIDTTAPTSLAFTWPVGTSISDGQQFDFGDSVPTPTVCTADYGVSGPGGCTVDPSGATNGNGTSSGDFTLKATATDKATNQATLSLTYHVLSWKITGFYQPVGTWNQIKGGATVPMKFNVYKAVAGTEITDPAQIASYGASSITCPASATTSTDTSLTTGGTSLRYDSTAGQFIFNWQSPKGSGLCYKVTVTTKSGSSVTANFMTK